MELNWLLVFNVRFTLAANTRELNHFQSRYKGLGCLPSHTSHLPPRLSLDQHYIFYAIFKVHQIWKNCRIMHIFPWIFFKTNLDGSKYATTTYLKFRDGQFVFINSQFMIWGRDAMGSEHECILCCDNCHFDVLHRFDEDLIQIFKLFTHIKQFRY